MKKRLPWVGVVLLSLFLLLPVFALAEMEEEMEIESGIGLSRKVEGTDGMGFVGGRHHVKLPRDVCGDGAESARFKLSKDLVPILGVKAEILDFTAE